MYDEDEKHMRDLIAMLALNGMLAHSTRYQPRDKQQHWHDAIAAEAYQLADAMLRRRKVGM